MQGMRFWEDRAMNYHLDGPMGRFTESHATPRRDGDSAPATSPLRDMVLIGLTALGARFHHEPVGPGVRRPRQHR